MNEYAAPLVDATAAATAAATIAMRVSDSADDMNHMYVMLSNTGPKIVGIRRTKPYSIGMGVDDEWIGRISAPSEMSTALLRAADTST
jgi:hypothetical protein